MILAFSVFTLNFAGIMHCSAALSDACCHTSKLVKPCCVKNLKITTHDRLSAHCGCSIKETGQTADLYIDLKNSSSNLTSKSLQNIPAIETGSYLQSVARIITGYSPPPVNSKDAYLTNLSIRI